MTTVAEMEELPNSNIKISKIKDKINETLARRNKREMEKLKKPFIIKLEETQKLKINKLEQKLLENKNDAEEWKAQLEACLTKIELNFE